MKSGRMEQRSNSLSGLVGDPRFWWERLDRMRSVGSSAMLPTTRITIVGSVGDMVVFLPSANDRGHDQTNQHIRPTHTNQSGPRFAVDVSPSPHRPSGRFQTARRVKRNMMHQLVITERSLTVE